MLGAADRYAYTGCGSTAYSVGTAYGGKGHLYTSGVRPARPVDDALLGRHRNPVNFPTRITVVISEVRVLGLRCHG